MTPSALLKFLKTPIYVQRKLQLLECWNRLEKLALIFLYNSHGEDKLLKLKIKKLLPKINVKNINHRVKYMLFCAIFVG